LFYKKRNGYQTFTFIAIKQIRDLKVAKEEQDIGFYAGFVGEQGLLSRLGFQGSVSHSSHKVACAFSANSLVHLLLQSSFDYGLSSVLAVYCLSGCI
jgi:hypothetical protein